MSKSDPNAPKRLALIASKGTLDWAYPPFILASAAGAMGWEVGIFFTFLWTHPSQAEIDRCGHSRGKPCHADENAVWSRRVPEHQLAHPTTHYGKCSGIQRSCDNVNEANL